jgi:hypothetical protein
MCKITNTPISFLLHPLDLIGGDQITKLAFFPGMNVSSDKKVDVFKNVIKTISKNYDMVNMTKHLKDLAKNRKMQYKKI